VFTGAKTATSKVVLAREEPRDIIITQAPATTGTKKEEVIPTE